MCRSSCYTISGLRTRPMSCFLRSCSVLDLNNPWKQVTMVADPIPWWLKSVFGKNLQALQKIKRLLESCASPENNTTPFLESTVRSIGRLPRMSNLFLFRRYLAPTFLYSKLQKGRLPPNYTHSMASCQVAIIFIQRRVSLHFSLEGRLLRKSNVKTFIDTRRILSVKPKGSIKLCYPLKVNRDLILNLRHLQT